MSKKKLSQTPENYAKLRYNSLLYVQFLQMSIVACQYHREHHCTLGLTLIRCLIGFSNVQILVKSRH